MCSQQLSILHWINNSLISKILLAQQPSTPLFFKNYSLSELKYLCIKTCETKSFLDIFNIAKSVSQSSRSVLVSFFREELSACKRWNDFNSSWRYCWQINPIIWLDVCHRTQKALTMRHSYSKLFSGNLVSLFEILFKLKHVWDWLTTPITMGVSVELFLCLCICQKIKMIQPLTHFSRMLILYRNQSFDLQCKSNYSFLHEMQHWVELG